MTDGVVHRPEARRFELDLGPDGVAYVAYRRHGPDVLDLLHTFVPEAEQGRGVASRLIEGVFADARREGLRLVPTCPYVAAWLASHPEVDDVVAR